MALKESLHKKLAPYQKRYGFQQKHEWDKIVLKKYMSTCKNILDVGCGVGRFIQHNPKRITGIDHNTKSIGECKKKGYRAVVGGVTKFPFKDSSFDGVHCAHVIEHLMPEDAYKMLSEMNRVLKKGGVLVIRAPLMHPEFWDDFTHLKIYNPESILHYISTKKQTQRTMDEIPATYKLVALKYRHLQLFNGIHKRKIIWPLFAVFNGLARIHIRTPRRSGYMLVLKKIK